MKCIAVVLLLSVAVAKASVIPAWPWAAPWVHAAPAIQQISIPPAPAAVVLGAPAISYAHHVAVAPAVKVIAAAPAAAPAVVVAGPAPSASYTAANRGSVHNAPLPGHATSQVSLNLQPAPGTL